jgi:hypothetical protein
MSNPMVWTLIIFLWGTDTPSVDTRLSYVTEERCAKAAEEVNKHRPPPPYPNTFMKNMGKPDAFCVPSLPHHQGVVH